jgi:DNA primase large subunit
MCEFFENIIHTNEQFTTPTNDIVNLALYPLLQIAISLIGNRIISNGFRNIYAKHCQSELKKINAKIEYPDQILEKISINIGVNCQLLRKKKVIGRIQYPFTMKFDSFLKTASRLKEDRWKLINNHFVDGQVFLIRDNVIYLLREEIRKKVSPDINQIDDDLRAQLEQIPEIKNLLKHVEDLISKNADRFNSSLMASDEKIGSDLYAPCIRVILYKGNQGENLNHNERLAIAFYFLNTNHTIEETVDIFRTSPDFDESIARYQVEFAGGVGGKGKKYSMYSCAKLKSLHLCFADHPKFGEKLCVDGFKKRNGEILRIHNPAGNYLFLKKVSKKQEDRYRQYIAAKNREKLSNQGIGDGKDEGEEKNKGEEKKKGDKQDKQDEMDEIYKGKVDHGGKAE